MALDAIAQESTKTKEQVDINEIVQDDDPLWTEVTDCHVEMAQSLKDVSKNKDHTEAAQAIMDKPPTTETAAILRDLIKTDKLTSAQQQLLQLHKRSNHCLSMTEIQAMAKEGHYPPS